MTDLRLWGGGGGGGGRGRANYRVTSVMMPLEYKWRSTFLYCIFRGGGGGDHFKERRIQLHPPAGK